MKRWDKLTSWILHDALDYSTYALKATWQQGRQKNGKGKLCRHIYLGKDISDKGMRCENSNECDMHYKKDNEGKYDLPNPD